MKLDVLTQLCTIFLIPRRVNEVHVPTADLKKKKINLGKGRWKEKNKSFSMHVSVSQNVTPLGDA